MTIDLDHLRKHVPHYLTADDQAALVRELKAIAGGGTAGYVLSRYEDAFGSSKLQGDGWTGFQFYNWDAAELRSIRGLVLSNSCDIDPGNPRDVPARIAFAPLVKLANFEAVLEKAGTDPSRAKAKIEAIKAQRTTNIFFLPAGGELQDDYIVNFDEMQTIPAHAHVGEGVSKLFTLNNTGFYMLTLKLSVHFCRLQENVNRKLQTPAPAA